jgi:hypothetical protein
VHPRSQPVRLLAHRECIVEVLCRLGVDRERDQVAEIGAALVRHRRWIVRLELLAEAALYEEPLEHALDVAGVAEHALQLGPSPSMPDDGEIPGASVSQPFAIDGQRGAGCEDRLAHDELSPSGELDDEAISQLRP